MARMLLWLLAGASLEGCLLPQDDQVFPSLPPRKNSPLQIVGQVPAQRETTYLGTCAEQPAFQVDVSDLDLRDTLKAVWFIDRTPTSTAYLGAPVFPTGTERRTVSSPRDRFVTDLNALVGPTRRVVEVFVTDGDFTSLGETILAERPPVTWEDGSPVQLPDGGPVSNPASVDSYVWLVEVQSCP